MYNEEIEEPPVLHFLLEFRKYAEMIKIMMNQSLSQSVLRGYGWQPILFSDYEEHKIKKSIRNFTINQLIEINGSSYNRTKYYENRLLIQTIKRKLKSHIVEGEVRKLLWVQFTDIYVKKYLYEGLSQLEIASDFLQIINKDLKRTPTSPEVKNKAREVLVKFAKFNPYIGYCQGMNNVIVFFLEEKFSCQETFFIFKRITQIMLPCDYYSQVNSIVGYMKVFFQMLHFTHPSVYLKFKEIIKQMDSSFMVVLTGVFQWFVCLFTNANFHKNITRIIMDHLLLEGITVLFKATLAIFDHLQDHILKVNSFEQFMEVEKHIQSMTDERIILKRLNETYISQSLLSLTKQKYLETLKTNGQEGKKVRQKKEEKKCNLKWNACLQTISQNFQKQFTYDFFVFKTADTVEIKPNYLEKLNKQYFVPKKSAQLIDNVLIGRMQHTCRPSDTITQGSISDKKDKSQDQCTQKSKTPSKFLLTTGEDSKKTQINEDSERKFRQKISCQIVDKFDSKIGLAHSQSMAFMKEMIQNESIQNLLDFYDIDEMFQ